MEKTGITLLPVIPTVTCQDIHVDIASDILPSIILSGILSDIYSGNLFPICSGILVDNLTDSDIILSGILSDIYFDILSGILPDIDMT